MTYEEKVIHKLMYPDTDAVMSYEKAQKLVEKHKTLVTDFEKLASYPGKTARQILQEEGL